ncbi:MAG: hypothetical protein K0R14_968 [Burkholderiales bacterium]|jgi:hypothetical protein|nr:hypothetical protein [Burkholderiales bacterium]
MTFWRWSALITDTVIVTWIMVWIVYSIAVLIYLNYLSNKYLTPINRDPEIGDKELKKSEDLVKQYENIDTINILILSGGGLRGLVPLNVLSYIEKKTGKKAGELFDFIAGSSTGSITAAGLCAGDDAGGYKFSAKEIFDEYEANAYKIFRSPWYHQWFTCFGFFAPRYLPDGKLKVLEYYSGDLTIGELKGNLLVPVYNIDSNQLEIVKNWTSDRGHIHDNYLIKDLINGASSPPMIFPPIAFLCRGKKHLFIDPAVLLTNPLLHIFLHVRTLFPNKKLNIIHLGNGTIATAKYSYRNMFSFGLYGIYQYLFSAPGLSSKLAIEFMDSYLAEAETFDNKINFYKIVSSPVDELSPTSVSKTNMKKIQLFAAKMLNDNLQKIDELIDVLLDSRVSGKHRHDKNKHT